MTKSIVFATTALLALATIGCSTRKNAPQDAYNQVTPARDFTVARLQKKLVVFDERTRALTTILAQDGDFAMKVLVENDRQSPLISRMAERYRLLAGWSSLSILDSAGIAISSSPSSAYAEVAAIWKTIGPDTPQVTLDSITGSISLGLRKNFAIQDIPFSLYATILLDTAWIAELRPLPNATMCIKNGSTLQNAPFSSSIMVRHDTLFADGKRFLQSEIPLPGLTNGYSVVLLVPCMLE